MQRVLISVLVCLSFNAYAEETYSGTTPQPLFNAEQAEAYTLDRQPLRKILLDGIQQYMTQDGELLDEDVATLDQAALTAKQTDYSFAKSKLILAQKIYKPHPIGFYSGCRFELKQKLLVPDWKSCGFQPRKNAERAKRIEWEHVVPAWVFGHQLQCWQQGGRAYCRDNNAKFRQMEADLHNLVPAIGELNGDRSNLPYGMVNGEPRAYGKVNMEIDFQSRTAEPPDNVYGDVARISFYMKDRYAVAFSKQQLQLFAAWNNLDPVDNWEQQRNELIRQAQGNDNPYVTHYKKLDSQTIETTDNNWIDELYISIFNNRSSLPYFVFALATFLYLAYLKYRRQNPKPKTNTPAKTVEQKSKQTRVRNKDTKTK